MEIKPLRTDQEIKEFIKRNYGSYEMYRRVETNYSATLDRELADIMMKRELAKRDNNAERLIKERPDLCREYCQKTAVRVGLRPKS